uniref:Adenomatous polyposis coli protein n=1 Tax=Buteo japonicus TaxID=224669 RepID=A0A8C0BNR1_9AVES
MMAAASYDQLLKQVEALKMENSNLRQELEDNSNHLTKLETEASNMKVLQTLCLCASAFQLLPFVLWAGLNSETFSTSVFNRSLLLAELEKEEKEKDWYYAQLQNLTKRIDSLPLTENFSLQTDMTRRQLEYEARQIRAAMEEQLGTCQDMEKRAQVRVARIQQIEKDILRIRQLLQSQAVEAEVSEQLFVEMVYSLLSMLGTHDKDDMSRTLLAMSSSQDSCIAMRQSGCLPLLIQLLHGNDKDSVLLGNSRGSKEARARASAALHNIIHSQPDDKRGRREIRVLHLLEQIRAYCETCWEWQEAHEQGMDQDKNPMPAPVDHQICPAVCVLMKLSFDEEHRHAMNELGGLQAIAELLQVDCEMYGLTNDHYSVTLRRYAGMALTNLTFGDVANKATLCSMKGCMRALVAQLKSESEDLQQVIASVLRNLSWRADVNSKKTLREVGSVKALMECALEVKKESTLKSVLSALWNLSAHCTENKADICAVDGALAFLVGTLTYRSQTNTLAIIESGGGILRNVSSLIATNEDHRQILRENSCLQTLLQHLKSHSLTIVSNACGTLWNLSARNAKDQEALWDMGAVSMLKNLIHSKHKMIAMGSAAALRNLMANRPAKYKDANIMSPGSSLPSLHVRKQKALEAELDAQHLSETFDNIDNLSPKASHRNKQRHKQNIYSEYVLDSSRHDDGICRSESFNAGNMTVLSPYLNTTVLPGSSSSSRGNIENSRSEKDRNLDRDRAVGLTTYHPAAENTGNSSKRIGMQISTAAAQIAKVMEEVTSMHIPQEDRSSGSTSEMHCLTEDRNAPRRSATAHTHSNTYFPKSENSNRTCPVPYTKMEYKRASNDSLNSVSSTDGYGKRGQMKPSIESYSEDDESKFCSYGQYPADLAHKIHSANHMDDNDGELDTPINYSLKYSDEQLNSGRQSPSQNERWARPKHIIDDEMKQNEQSTKTDHISSSSGSTSAPSAASKRQNQLHPNSAQSRGGHAQKTASCKTPSINQETIQTYCVEDTPICFSRCSSLSSLSSAEDEIGRDQSTRVTDANNTLQIAELKENSGALSTEGAVTVEFSSGAKSPSKSGAQTPKSPPEHYVQETPLMFSRCTSVSSLDSFESRSIASSVQSEPCSGMVSGIISPSDLPDSPGQTMPPSRSKTPPPAQAVQVKRDVAKGKVPTVQRVQVLPDADTLLHFATESTPDGFSCSSSLSALSLDEPFIQKDVELRIMPPVHENEHGNEAETEQSGDTKDKQDKKAEKPTEAEKDILDDSDDDDIEILEACIISAMPTKSSRKAKKPSQASAPKIPPPVARKPSQLPVYKLLPSQSRLQSQKHVSFTPGDDMPRVYCVEGTPINFSTATSLSDLTIESPPSELANVDSVGTGAESGEFEKRDTIPTEGRSTDDSQRAKSSTLTPPGLDDDKTEEGDILAEDTKKQSLKNNSREFNDKLPNNEERVRGSFAFDSPHHYTPIEGTPYCFSRNDSLSSLDFDDDDDVDLSREKAELRKGKEKMQKFAIENTPVCFSCNSSLSSLSDIDQENNNNKEGEPAKHDTPVCFSRNSSLSSLSIDSEDDLLQECISSAMPKKKKPSRIKSESEKNNSRNTGGILAEDLTLDLREIQRPDSEHGFSPDSENFDWKAIQEGANSIVSSLHQAAAAASLSRQASSDSDSILSLKSGISLGSPFHLTPDQEEKPFTSNKGPRILKPGEKSTLESKKVESESRGIKGGKKVYKSIITGKTRSNSEVSSQLKQPQQTSVPSISRGRTMIHIPGVRNSSSSTSPVSKKGPPLKTTNSKSPSEGQSLTSSPRGVKSSVKPEPAPVTRQPSGLNQSGSSKGPSRSGSRDSTPSRPQQQPLSRPLQSPGRNSISPGRNGISPPNKLSQLPRTSSPSTASTKSSGSGRMSYTSPGRQMSQQNLTKQTALPKSTSSIPRSESASKGLNQALSSGGSNKKTELSRMSSAKSSGSESDRSERPVLVRQSTFIKEAPSPTLRRKLEESASFESLSPSRPDSPTRSQLQTPVLSPSLPDMSLSTHSTAQTSGWRKLPPNLSPAVEYDGRPAKRHDIARSHSESPSRLLINRSGTWKREHSKHSSSLPRVSTWRRTGSSSSILSASSESSEKAKSEDEKQHGSSLSGPKQSKESQAPAKGTWRKIKENEIPQIMNDPQHSSSGAANGSDSKTLIYQMAPAVSKTEDVWVRIEDCPINNPRSGRSPTGNTPPVIDSVSEKGGVNGKDSKEIQEKQTPGNGGVPVRTIGLENRLNSFFQIDSPDKKGTETKPLQNNPVPAPENNESTVSERTPFSSSSSSKHSSPIGAVAARVTPFNYNPSRRKSSVDNSSARPSQIPTPVNNSTKKRDSKSENPDSSGTQSPKRHSGSYLVTSV